MAAENRQDNTGPIHAAWNRMDTKRMSMMERLRQYAALTLPRILPSISLPPGGPLPKPYQGLGADGLGTLVSKTLVTLFARPWFHFRVGAALHTSEFPPDLVENFEKHLYDRERTIHDQIDRVPFRMKMRVVLEQILGLGNALFQITDERTIRTYRLDQWVQRRAPDYRVLRIITKEHMDPLDISDEIAARVHIKPEDIKEDTWENAPALDLYTQITWQRDTRLWLIEQEMNEQVAHEPSEEKVNPFVSVGYVEIPGEDYSRGLIEEKEGDLRSFEGLTHALVDAAGIAAKMNPVLDYSSTMKPSDLVKENGAVLRGRVEGGQVQDVAFLHTDKAHDMQFARLMANDISLRVSKGMLMELNVQPQGERVTATQVLRVARELDAATGGVYSNIADELQRPTVRRYEHLMEKANELAPLPVKIRDKVNVEITTGIAAMSRQLELERISAALQVVAPIPGALDRVKVDTVTTAIFEGFSLDTNKLLMTDDEVAEKQREYQQQAAQMAAQQEMAKSQGAALKERAAAETPA